MFQVGFSLARQVLGRPAEMAIFELPQQPQCEKGLRSLDFSSYFISSISDWP